MRKDVLQRYISHAQGLEYGASLPSSQEEISIYTKPDLLILILTHFLKEILRVSQSLPLIVSMSSSSSSSYVDLGSEVQKDELFDSALGHQEPIAIVGIGDYNLLIDQAQFRILQC